MGTLLTKMMHSHGLRLIKSVPGVISATHVERKKYLVSGGFSPQYLIRIKYRKNGKSMVKEVLLKTHPDNITLKEYKFIVSMMKDEQ